MRKFGFLAFSAILMTGCLQPPSAVPIPGIGSGGVSCKFSRADEAHVTFQNGEKFLQSPHSSNGFQKLHGHVPNVVKKFADQGAMADEQELPVTLALSLSNEADLDQKLQAMYDPANPQFHQFMKPEEFRSRYAPTDDQVKRVQDYLTSKGFSNISVNENRLFIKAQGTVQKINSVFSTEVHQYKDQDGNPVFSPAYELQVPSDLPVRAVHGLQNVTHFKTHIQVPDANAVSPKMGTGPGNGFSPADIRTAYRIPTTVNGAGQTLALFELDGYNPADIAKYEKNFSLPAVPLQNILVDGASGFAGNGAGEVTLDIELMIAVAPGINKVIVYEGPNSDIGVLDTYSRIANDNLAHQISTSWGTPENATTVAAMQSEYAIFKQMAAQGQTIYSASGDSGALDDGKTLRVDDPSSQPYVVGVGGTQLTTNSNGSYNHEKVWNGNNTASGGASGGGISQVWSIPSWQKSAVTAASKGSTSMRNVPDVALNADPNTGYSIYFNGSWNLYGGTSCAAPLWAAFTALVNQQRSATGLSVIGFATPTFYQIGQSNHYASDFFDVADGSTNIFYPAVNGYDDATGWGSFNGSGLFSDLSQDPAYVVNGNSCGT